MRYKRERFPNDEVPSIRARLCNFETLQTPPATIPPILAVSWRSAPPQEGAPRYQQLATANDGWSIIRMRAGWQWVQKDPLIDEKEFTHVPPFKFKSLMTCQGQKGKESGRVMGESRANEFGPGATPVLR